MTFLTRENGKRLLRALSFANLLLLGEWINLLAPYLEGPDAERAVLTMGSILGILGTLSLVAFLFFFLEVARAKVRSSFVLCAVLATYCFAPLLALNAIRLQNLIDKTPLLLGLALSLSVFLTSLFGKRGKWFIVDRFAYALLPCLALTFFELGTISTQISTRQTIAKEWVSKPADIDAKKSKARVVVVLFDSLDFKRAFIDSHPDIFLPNLEKFRTSSFEFLNAASPGDYTAKSIPALLSGKYFQDEPIQMPNDILMYPRNSSEPVLLSEIDSVFHRLRKQSYKTGLVGWYLPYCSALRDDLDECNFRSRSKIDYSGKPLLAAAEILNRNFFQFERAPLHQNTYEILVEQSVRAIGKEDLDFLFLHESAPHKPFIYDAQKKSFVVDHPRPERAYYESLELVDTALAHLLDAVNATKRARNTYVIVTSDHGFMEFPTCGDKESLHVPFMIRTPQKLHSVEAEDFETIRLGDLIPEILNGKIRTNSDIAAWSKLDSVRH